jgi:NAD(P)H dehydrogenase (quinone)
MSPNIAVVYYSATGTVHCLAEAVADGAASAGAEVRLRRVPELAPETVVAASPLWAQHAASVAVPVAALEDLTWADGYAFGTPTRFGSPAAQLKQFIDQTGPLWQQGAFAGKPATAFTAAINAHGGQESTILSLGNVFYHWGSIIVPPGYTDPVLYGAGGNPYGTSFATGVDGRRPDEAALAAARHQGRRLAEITARLTAGQPHPAEAGARS